MAKAKNVNLLKQALAGLPAFEGAKLEQIPEVSTPKGMVGWYVITPEGTRARVLIDQEFTAYTPKGKAAGRGG